jgi:hypothetical protein
VFTIPIQVFTMPIRAFTFRRSGCSRWTDPRVHDAPKSAGVDEWTAIACQASWQTTRMNLAAFERHGVFKQSA